MKFLNIVFGVTLKAVRQMNMMEMIIIMLFVHSRKL